MDLAGFNDADRRLAAAAADFGAEMLRQALAERQTQRVLFDAVEAALGASDSVAASLRGAADRADDPPPAAVMERLKEGLQGNADAGVGGGETLRLAEAVRVLALRHGDDGGASLHGDGGELASPARRGHGRRGDRP